MHICAHACIKWPLESGYMNAIKCRGQSPLFTTNAPHNSSPHNSSRKLDNGRNMCASTVVPLVGRLNGVCMGAVCAHVWAVV